MTTDRWSPAFETDTDYVGTQTAYVDSALAIPPVDEDTPGYITLTTTTQHGFQVGAWVTVVGVGELFDGTYVITDILDGSSFSYEYFVDIGVDLFFLAPPGLVSSPAVSYVRWGQDAPVVDDITTRTTLYTEGWDYNTIRVVWGVDNATSVRASRDLALGLEPRVVIVRSGFGTPLTPWDGIAVLDRSFLDLQSTHGFETMPANLSNDWNREILTTQGLYDRNLPSGKWFYYTAFYWLGEYDTLGALIRQAWAVGESHRSIVPVNHHHAAHLYDLIPEYYRVKDQEFIAGTGRKGVVERLLQVVGFELDTSRSLAEGIEHVYDIDGTHDALLHSLGLLNFGVRLESGLGDIRYRSLLATISRLYEERGSALGLKKMTDAATKYRSKVVEGLNLMCLTDDAEFASGTGSWGNPFPHYASFMESQTWFSIESFLGAEFASVSLMTSPEGPGEGTSLVPRRNAMLVSPTTAGGFDSAETSFDDDETPFDYGGATAGLLITCGLGEGVTQGRRHEDIEVDFFPRLHGIRCDPEVEYTFSAYTILAEPPNNRAFFDSDDLGFDDDVNFDGLVALPGQMTVGILWFNDAENGVFDVEADFLQRDEAEPLEEVFGTNTPMRRVIVGATAPLPKWGREHVFAVPYLLFEDSSHSRYISACMFHTDRREFVVEALA